MAMARINLTIPQDLIDECKRYNINVSELTRSAIESFVNRKLNNVEAQNLQNLKEQLKIEHEKLIKQQGKVEGIKRNIETVEELLKLKESDRLKLEQENLEKQITCLHCGNIISGKIMKLPKGNMCKYCFMTVTSEQMKEYMV